MKENPQKNEQHMNNKIIAVLLALAAISLLSARADNVRVTNTAAQAIPVTQAPLVGGAALAANFYSAHITTNTTNTVVSSTAYAQTLVIACTNAGSAWTITVRSKEATPTVLYTATLAVGTTTPVSVQVPGVISTSGIDVITAGTTPGVVDVKINYWK
jgi:hypothetical protein